MIKNKTFLTISVSLLALGLVFVGIAQAASSATVNATVTMQNVSVSVSDGSITYGTLAASTSKSTTASDLNDGQTATNNGNVAEDISIKGQNSANWTLAGSAGVDQYVHKFCTGTCTTPPTSYSALTTNYQTLSSNLSASGTQTFDLQITMPSSSTTYTQQAVDVVVLAAAH